MRPERWPSWTAWPPPVRLRVQYAGGPWTWALIVDGREVIAADQADTWQTALRIGGWELRRVLETYCLNLPERASAPHGARWRPWRRRCRP